jgi:hypothetical protein
VNALLLVPMLAAAPPDVAEADRWLSTDRIAVGVDAGGSLVNGTVGLGLLWDPDGPEGPMPAGGDWLTWGDPFEVWSLAYTGPRGDAVLVQGGAWGGRDLTLAWDGPYDSGAVTWLHGTAANADLSVETWIEVPWERDVTWFVLRLEALADLTDVKVARVADPDPDAWVTGSGGTHDTAGSGFAAAEGSLDARTIAIAANGGQGGICSWCTTPDEVAAGSQDPIDGDLQIGVAVSVGDLPAGETAGVTFALGLALGSDDAVALARVAAEDDDHDADGHTASGGDCDDRDAAVNPSAAEVPNGLDDDCDGSVDEDSAWTDDDGDGYAEADGDCDDSDPSVHPGADPVEGVSDADCDGLSDTGGWPPALDTGEPPAEEEGGGCGCRGVSGRVPSPGLLALLLALAARRRSR